MMKKFIITILAAISYCTISAQNNNMAISSADTLAAHYEKENALGAAIFKALQSKNLNEWMALYPTNAEYKSILQVGLAAKVEGLTQQKIDEMIERRKQEAAAAYGAEFAGYQRQADSLRINWSDAVFGKFNFDSVYPEEVKLKYLTGAIKFSCKQDHFVIDGIQAVEIDTGYRLQAVNSISRMEDDR